ncbi:MAG TPA: alcohol dehydrogenase catalytic domain-containing protein, partial [Trebonia sp.]|nr:alcohol dehydrogenase catalytic domain-containing protein [Trebonia sp.]
MRAAMFYDRRDIRIEEVPPPVLRADTDVLVEVLACGICGTDASEWAHGPLFAPLAARHPASGHQGPTVLGHELLGRVAAVGPAVSGLRPGDRVVSGGGVWCGECRWCRAGRYNLCAQWWVIGLDAHGALAEQVVVPAKILVPVPRDLPDRAAVLAQPLAVASHAVNRAAISAGSRVL